MSRISEVKKNYPITSDLAIQIDNSKNNKYLNWIAKALVTTSKEQVTKAILIFEDYNHCFSEKDIYKYSADQILNTPLEESNRSERSSIKDEGSILLDSGYNGNSWSVRRILTLDAMRLYGSGTKWCVTQEGTWLEYIFMDNSRMYIYTNGRDKYGICISKNDNDDFEIYDATDNQRYLSKIKESWRLIKAIQEDNYQTKYELLLSKKNKSQKDKIEIASMFLDNVSEVPGGQDFTIFDFISDYINSGNINLVIKDKKLSLKLLTLFSDEIKSTLDCINQNLTEDIMNHYKDDKDFYEIIYKICKNYSKLYDVEKYITKENPHYSKLEKKIKEQQRIIKLEEQNLIKREKMIQALKSSGFSEKDINILLTLKSNDSKKGN
jgi:hypothetical protein